LWNDNRLTNQLPTASQSEVWPLILPALGKLLLASHNAAVPDEAIFAVLDEAGGPSDEYERHLQGTNIIRALNPVIA
jgi:hypothetical protein